jgi:hypothetical protein
VEVYRITAARPDHVVIVIAACDIGLRERQLPLQPEIMDGGSGTSDSEQRQHPRTGHKSNAVQVSYSFYF